MTEEQNNQQESSAPNASPPSTAGKGLGIAGFVVGVVAMILSFVPCFGMYALFPGIIGIVLSAVSIKQASKANAAKGLAIAGLVCSLLGTAIAYGQFSAVDKAVGDIDKAGKKFKKDMNNVNEKFKQDMGKVQQKFDKDMKSLQEKTKSK